MWSCRIATAESCADSHNFFDFVMVFVQVACQIAWQAFSITAVAGASLMCLHRIAKAVLPISPVSEEEPKDSVPLHSSGSNSIKEEPWDEELHYDLLNLLDTHRVFTLGAENCHSSGSWGREGGDPCPICLDDFQEGDFVAELSCGHLLHTDCADGWLDRCPALECPFKCPQPWPSGPHVEKCQSH